MKTKKTKHTHTIRRLPHVHIITLNKWFFEQCDAVDVEAFGLTWAVFEAQYRRLTGMNVSLNHEQQTALWAKRCDPDGNGYHLSRVATLPGALYYGWTSFTDGLLNKASLSFEETLEVADRMFKLFEPHFRPGHFGK